MRFLRVGIAALLLAAATAACSGSGDTGSSGGWRVSGAHIRTGGDSQPCRTPSPVLDTFSATPSPQPDCTPAAAGGMGASANPSPSAPASAAWQKPHTEDYRSATSQAWHPIYTTYTAPPGTGVYQPMVHATEQPMPTPFTTPTPNLPTATPLPTTPPMPTQPPSIVQPSATP